ncbi:hypothetical protein Tcan_05713 [Toxocara canis]|uniref:Uncharacterized protein n=1 Tax=Toxocara canis TaxID=6265 RepID=A0A0B2W3W5_TOXCA|nr:hypothetical protein Tcan_05713 [Toxocara canis]
MVLKEVMWFCLLFFSFILIEITQSTSSTTDSSLLNAVSETSTPFIDSNDRLNTSSESKSIDSGNVIDTVFSNAIFDSFLTNNFAATSTINTAATPKWISEMLKSTTGNISSDTTDIPVKATDIVATTTNTVKSTSDISRSTSPQSYNNTSTDSKDDSSTEISVSSSSSTSTTSSDALQTTEAAKEDSEKGASYKNKPCGWPLLMTRPRKSERITTKEWIIIALASILGIAVVFAILLVICDKRKNPENKEKDVVPPKVCPLILIHFLRAFIASSRDQ